MEVIDPATNTDSNIPYEDADSDDVDEGFFGNGRDIAVSREDSDE